MKKKKRELSNADFIEEIKKEMDFQPKSKLTRLVREKTLDLDRKKKNILKKKGAIYTLTITGVLTSALTFSSLICADNFANKKSVFINNTNYSTFNTAYRSEQIESLTEQKENGSLSDSEFLEKVEDIEDYDELTYLREHEPEKVDEYNSLVKKESGNTYAIFPSMLGSIALLTGSLVLQRKRENSIEDINESIDQLTLLRHKIDLMDDTFVNDPINQR